MIRNATTKLMPRRKPVLAGVSTGPSHEIMKPYSVSSPAQPRPRLAKVTPIWVTDSSRSGLARRSSADCAPALPPAANEDYLLLAQGSLTAQERLFQMDALRRQAAGDLSEIVGMAALESDREMRRLRLRRIAEDAYVSLPPKDRAALAAYARGVSFYISTHLDRLPFEFKVLGYDPRPWSVVDCILAGLQMYKTLTTTWPDELLKRNMLAAGDPAKVNFLMPVRTGREMPPGLLAPLGGDAHAAS